MKYLINLNVHSNYSFLSSTIKLEDYVNFAQKNNLNKLVLTDKNVMYGALHFYQLCKERNINPIIGLDCWWNYQDEKVNIILLSTNYEGYQTLIKVSTFLNTNNLFLSNKEIQEYILNNSNIIVIIKTKNIKNFSLKQIWFFLNTNDNVYFGIEENNINDLSFISMLTKKIVATNLVTYLEKEEVNTFQVLNAIKNNITLKENDLKSHGPNYYKNEFELKKIFPDWILENNETLINKCNLILPKLSNKQKIQQLPKFKTANNISSQQYLKELCQQGLKKRFNSKNISKVYITRIFSELKIINLMGFNDYFLIVQDYIKFAKQQNITVGPGRGSVAGSLVAYVLEITDVDPIKYNLIFERFLNSQRTSLPDIDVDFEDERREEIFQYLSKKYGHNHVSHIITFQTIASKMAIRDLGKVFNISLEDINEISKLIPIQSNFNLSQAINDSPKLLLYTKKYPLLFNFAKKILGFFKQTSTHAAGIILSNKPLINLIPLQNGFNNIFLTQYSMKELEAIGLIKMDILGLRNLTILSNIIKKVENTYKIKLELNKIPLNDNKTFKVIANGNTAGIFQLESYGMQKILKAIKPNNIEDIIATNALFRPGPQDYIKNYINRKMLQEQFSYSSSALESILKSTYGIILYQEQILLILQKVAGFSLAKADLIRQAISKKNEKEMNLQENLFINNALKNGYKLEITKKIWNDIKQFAGYGFNRSHAVAYSLISYWMMYLKVNYSLAFMSCLLTNSIGNEQKIIQYLHECQKFQIKVLPPNINKSESEFLIDKKNNSLIYSLQAINKINFNICQSLVDERNKNGLFFDFFNFCARAIFIGLSIENIESLINAGALDEINNNRTMLLMNLDNAVKYANIAKIKDPNNSIKLNLKFKPPLLISYESNWIETSMNEYKSLGFYLIYNPEKKWKEQLDKDNQTVSLTSISDYINKNIKVIGKITNIKTIKTKNDQTMAFLTIENNNTSNSVTVFNNSYKNYQNQLQINNIILIEAKVERYQNKEKLILYKVLNTI